MTGGCERCGSFRGLGFDPKRKLCENHHQRRLARSALLMLASLAVYVAFFASFGDVPPGAALAWLLPVSFGVLVAHEGAHWVVGHLVGLRIGRLSIGAGPRVLRRGAPRGVVLRLLPWSGFVEVGVPGDPRRARWRAAWAAMAAAGPATNVALLLLALPRYGSPLGLVVVVTVAILTLSDLLALTSRDGRRTNDLANLVRSVRRRPPVVADTPRGWPLTTSEFWDAVERVHLAGYRLDRVLDAVTLIAAIEPDPRWRLYESVALMQVRRYGDARAALRTLDGRDVAPDVRADVDNVLAWIHALLGDDLGEARRRIEAALALHPDSAAALGTAALVAARQGRLDEAETLCVPEQVATIDATRAYVAAARGDHAAAETHAARARALDPACEVLDLIPGCVPIGGPGRVGSCEAP